MNMNLHLLHTNPETLHGFEDMFEEMSTKYLDKLLELVEEDELLLILDLFEEENKLSELFFNTRRGNCPFDDGSGSNDYHEIFHEYLLPVYYENWPESESEYLALWTKMKPELIIWLKSGYKKQSDNLE